MSFPRPNQPAPEVVEDEHEYKVTMHLTNGDVFEIYGTVSASDLLEVYRGLGSADGRIKFPTSPTEMHFLPATSVFRIEAVGNFD